MKPLERTQQLLAWGCVCRPDKSTPKWQKSFYIIFSVIVSLSELFVVSVCAFLFLSYYSIDLEAALYPLFQMFGHSVALYGFLYIVSANKIIDEMFKKLAVIYDKCKQFKKLKTFLGKNLIIFIQNCLTKVILFKVV